MKTITYYPLKMIDGLWHVWKRTEEHTPMKIEEETLCHPYEDEQEAKECVEMMNRMSNSQDEQSS
jgi:hypothetical protein